jgi:Tfp pilus assembly PilM family ATPase
VANKNQDWIGIELGSNYFRVIDYRSTFGHVTMNEGVVEHIQCEFTVRGVRSFGFDEEVMDKSNILKPEMLQLELEKAIKELKPKSKRLALSLENSLVLTRDVQIPQVEKKLMDSVVAYEIKESLLIDTSEYHIQYKLVDQIDSEVKKHVMSTVILSKTLYQDIWDLVGGLGLKPVRLDINSNALNKEIMAVQSFNNIPIRRDQTFAVFDIDFNRINLYFISDGNVDLNRKILLDADDDRPLADRIYQQFDTVQNTFRFYLTHKKNKSISNILLMGQATQDENLDELFEESLLVPAKTIHTISNVTNQTKSNLFLPMIGAAIEVQSGRRTGR